MAEPEPPPATIIVQPPTTAMQFGGQTVNHIAAALSAQPLLLVIVVLNIVFASIGGYFLLQLEKYRSQNTTGLIALMRDCILETVPSEMVPSDKRSEWLPLPDVLPDVLPNSHVTRT